MTTAEPARQLGPAALNLKNIDDIAPLQDDDRACFMEIRDVLSKHGKLDRFGLTLLHKHFDVYEGETLLETCDSENRTMTITVMKKEDIQTSRVVQTNWRLDLGVSTQSCPYTIECMQGCLEVNGAHNGQKLHTGPKKVHL